jgi:hypothetical protein
VERQAFGANPGRTIQIVATQLPHPTPVAPRGARFRLFFRCAAYICGAACRGGWILLIVLHLG